MSFSKYIGGAIGWAAMGPIGALLGFIIGSAVDGLTDNKKKIGGKEGKRYRTKSGDFASSFLVLSAAVMKADGRHLKSELEFIRSYFSENFKDGDTTQYMVKLKQLLETEINLRQVCTQIRYYMHHRMRLQLLQYLFEIAQADGQIDSSELNVIGNISKYLGISYKDYESIRAMYYAQRGGRSSYSRRERSQQSSSRVKAKRVFEPYKILGITEEATDAEVKKAYRAMARKYHPDAVSTLGEEFIEKAKERFIVVDEAYQYIKEKRGIK